MIPLLPIWCLTNPAPSLYDVESATAIEMTAKLYAKMNELIKSYNEFSKGVNDKVDTTLGTELKDYVNSLYTSELVNIVTNYNEATEELTFSTIQGLTNKVFNATELLDSAIQGSTVTFVTCLKAKWSEMPNGVSYGLFYGSHLFYGFKHNDMGIFFSRYTRGGSPTSIVTVYNNSFNEGAYTLASNSYHDY